MACNTLLIVLGDQLDPNYCLLKVLSPKTDVVWMAEVAHESTKVWSHKARIAIFLAAMRHYRDDLIKKGYTVDYTQLDSKHSFETFTDALDSALSKHQPKQVVMLEAGEWAVEAEIKSVCQKHNIPLTFHPDPHFYCSREWFETYASQHQHLRMEYFYRQMRHDNQILLDDKAKPEGKKWNFDAENRGAFDKSGPPSQMNYPHAFKPDAITQAVLKTVEALFADHPGSLKHFDWAVTPEEAKIALKDFITHRLPYFGQYQDAMWLDAEPGTPLFATNSKETTQPYLFHSRISSALNLKLLDPREVVEAAEKAYYMGHASLSSVEGFIRQIVGWREYVRGIYWLKMPDYIDLNFMDAQQALPDFYWTADTKMTCLSSAIGQTLEYGYSHHIQRLMVTGLFALLLGVKPQLVHEWYLAVYVDAVEWVELPNTLGMSQFGDGGLMGSKPYVASGKYISRMSNYCTHCPYDPNKRLGEKACPFTTLYWDYLIRHQQFLAKNPRMMMQVRNLTNMRPAEKEDIQAQARALREQLKEKQTV